MGRSLIDSSVLKAFVLSIKQKLFSRSEGGSTTARESSAQSKGESATAFLKEVKEKLKVEGTVPSDTLGTFLSLMRKDLEKRGDSQSKKKLELCELILPKVIVGSQGDRFEVDPNVAKDWAFACAQMLGVMAGIAVSPNKVDPAVDEAASVAKKVAKDLIKTLGGTVTKASQDAVSKMKDEAETQSRDMIKSLTEQAESETDPAAAAALRAMAESIRKTLPDDKAA